MLACLEPFLVALSGVWQVFLCCNSWLLATSGSELQAARVAAGSELGLNLWKPFRKRFQDLLSL